MARGETVRIATRKSPLALWQARAVGTMLQQRWPAMAVELVELSTEGDRVLDTPLSRIGGKGLFIRSWRRPSPARRADLAVHSLKDVTSAFPPGLVLAAVPDREDPRDAWVSPGGVPYAALPRGARVGTSSLRRACQLRAARPDVEVVPLRGNVGTRVRKTAELGLAGAILALAGLRRLGLEGEVTEVLPVQVMLPAVGGGAGAGCRAEAPPRPARGVEHARTRVGVGPARLSRGAGGRLHRSPQPTRCGRASRCGCRLVSAPDGSEVLRASGRPAGRARALGAPRRGAARPRGARTPGFPRRRALVSDAGRLRGVRVLLPTAGARPGAVLPAGGGGRRGGGPGCAGLEPPTDPRPLQAAAELSVASSGLPSPAGGRWRRWSRPPGPPAPSRSRSGSGAIGPGTAAACRPTDWRPSWWRRWPLPRGWPALLPARALRRGAAPAAEDGRRALEEALSAAGIAVQRVAAYRSSSHPDPDGWAEVCARPPRCVPSARRAQSMRSSPLGGPHPRRQAVAIGGRSGAGSGLAPAAIAPTPRPRRG
jgi:hydroxymethylbilane synthase